MNREQYQQLYFLHVILKTRSVQHVQTEREQLKWFLKSEGSITLLREDIIGMPFCFMIYDSDRLCIYGSQTDGCRRRWGRGQVFVWSLNSIFYNYSCHQHYLFQDSNLQRLRWYHIQIVKPNSVRAAVKNH